MKTVFLLLLVGLLGACATGVRSKVAVFSVPSPELQGTVKVLSLDPALAETLAFEHYRQSLASHLSPLGLEVVTEAAEFEALLGYQVTEAQPENAPVNGSLWWRSGYPRNLGTSVVVVHDGDTRRQYQREVTLVIRRASTQERIYEASATSLGSCEALVVVFDEMVAAIVKTFPQPSGSVQTVSVPGDTKC